MANNSINIDDLIGDLDIVGDDEFMGGDLDEVGGPSEDLALAQKLIASGAVGDLDIVGASPNQRRQLQGALARAARLGAKRMQAKLRQGPTVVETNDADRKVQTVLIPFVYPQNGGIVPAQTEVELVGKTGTPAKIISMAWDNETVDDFGFRGLKFGMDDIFAGAGLAPASIFQSTSVINKLLQQTKGTATEFTMRVFNRSTDGRLPIVAALALGVK